MNKSDADFVLLGGDFNVDPKVNLRADQFWLFKLCIDQGGFDAFFLLLMVCLYLKRVAIKDKCMQVNANETSYQDVKNIMTNSIEEFFHKIEVKKTTHLNEGPSIFLYPSIFRTGWPRRRHHMEIRPTRTAMSTSLCSMITFSIGQRARTSSWPTCSRWNLWDEIVFCEEYDK